MERIAFLEILEEGTRLLFVSTEGGKFKIEREIKDSFPIGEEIFFEKLIRPATVSKVISVLTTYREMAQKHGIKTVYGIATQSILNARNQKGLIEELYNNTGVFFSIMTNDDCVKNLFLSVNNNIDISKGYCVHVGKYNTLILKYNRRTVLNSISIEKGYLSFENENSYDQVLESFGKVLRENDVFKVEENESVVLCGNPAINFGRIGKKIARYSLDIDNNYSMTKELSLKTFDFVKNLDMDKISKLKNTTDSSPISFLHSVAIINAVCREMKLREIIISTTSLNNGVHIALTQIENQEKLSDLLATSFDTYEKFSNSNFKISQRVVATSAILFKQLKVLHKLPRAYVKPLRLASYMFDSGKVVSVKDYEKNGFYIILNSGICGISQRDLLIASFICLCQNPSNFNLSEWVKYKDILIEEDLIAVRKLGIILKLSTCLNNSFTNNINDILCEILGDSVIMKLITTENCKFNIRQGLSISENFSKIFKKNLQIL